MAEWWVRQVRNKGPLYVHLVEDLSPKPLWPPALDTEDATQLGIARLEYHAGDRKGPGMVQRYSSIEKARRILEGRGFMPTSGPLILRSVGDEHA